MAKTKKPESGQQETLSRKKALELYKTTINFNVINRYDPAVKKLLYNTSYCVVYKFDDSTEQWNKTDYQGTLTLYLRSFQVSQQNFEPTLQSLQNLFCYGLILLNRNNPECFSIGLLPNNVTKHYFPRGVDHNGISQMDVELNDNLIIVKSLLGDIYGLWVFNEVDRMKLFKLLQFCLTTDSSTL
ncbi:mRNA-decapping enzyme subunit 1 [Yamadazyma tenuis]|uniref:Decapping protein n=1 Tax=Candida tenuis (strain ATCC 10573 / BCRC 21748 / CBS 615 / JCM 9827 / NBRC 10315 / NRRL Y-1498 / VKM Y-70) TaxID=590646 RepID=G3B847_CANTC|nr:decapping protein [Yamadazyma tenuis ATCC 10573]XP_006689048.1 uncharacterized protein CANTEDRAFT_115810 [Yamadazyma tenuis ATCC 10573]EGV62877.1 decapping protein [Yamadazyma tenuis ATCC 10573]EGV62878.1 hypothetical protein CANTEDRAFT_115810 [Yamadazyma tenuis ATCC 10573]WEJ93612.1 mRNA-decapping enzyme subunit 1 [Yamadazyma tenuis]